jgi:hypothetical protein
MQKKGKNAIYLTLTGIVILLMVILVIVHQSQPLNSSIPEATPEAVLENAAKKHNGPSFVTINTTISADVIQDGLRDMGELATEEYYFKEVVSYSSIKQLLGLNLGLTESSYLAGYEGVIKAGIDFTEIKVGKDDDNKIITVTLPRTRILSSEINPDSFELYSEKEGWGNPISVTDYNNSLAELVKKAETSATERGVLEKAGENAQLIIRNFIMTLLGDPSYSVQFEAAK